MACEPESCNAVWSGGALHAAQRLLRFARRGLSQMPLYPVELVAAVELWQPVHRGQCEHRVLAERLESQPTATGSSEIARAGAA